MNRNPRRAYDAEGREIEPMSLANMREHGVRSVEATCELCKHEACVSVDNLPGDIYVPDVALRLRCSACGSKQITTRPDWTGHQPLGGAVILRLEIRDHLFEVGARCLWHRSCCAL